MKISFEKNKNPESGGREISIAGGFLSVSDLRHVLCAQNGDKEIFFEGEIYYTINGEKVSHIKKNEYAALLSRKISGFDVSSFVNTVEGIYNAVYIDKGKNEVVIFCDYLQRRNFFYANYNGIFTASNNLENIISGIGEVRYNQEGLHSYLTMGYTPAYQTLYDGIERFSVNEYVKISAGSVKNCFLEEVYSVENYGLQNIEKYDRLISDSVISRSADTNFVLNSGGWDSTAIIFQLLQAHEASKVNSFVYETKLKDGQIYNIYESDKVKKIADYYGIKSETIEIDFGNKSLIDDWKSLSACLKKNHTYFFVDMPKAVNDIFLKDSSASVFSGEASDSIHNFGFSQYVSVTYPGRALREYGDKMKSYLFSPEFFSKVKGDSFEEDRVYQFFRYYFGDENFEKNMNNGKEKYIRYFNSFMISGGRVPFFLPIESEFARSALKNKVNENLNGSIFEAIAEKADAGNLYFYLLQLYRFYHFHSPQIEVKHSPMREANGNCKIPFLDISLLKFMYSMPQCWGRGLEMSPTKFPLRYLAKEKWNFPRHILEDAEAHSYIAESDKRWNYSGGKWNLNCETIYNSVFGEAFKEILSEAELEKYFSPEYFKTELMKKTISEYLDGKQDLSQSGFIYKLGSLFFTGLYE
ncbi:MAG: hypothetical protein JSS63_01880 [Bacteroidetes bacterium]|nr:hypothetical protein [Bacteroidota bacterium]